MASMGSDSIERHANIFIKFGRIALLFIPAHPFNAATRGRKLVRLQAFTIGADPDDAALGNYSGYED